MKPQFIVSEMDIKPKIWAELNPLMEVNHSELKGIRCVAFRAVIIYLSEQV